MNADRGWTWGEIAAVAAAMALALGLGRLHLDAPSMWHDELVHVFVAKDIAATGTPHLPSGEVYPSALAFNYLLGIVVYFFGDGPVFMRMPSVLVSCVNVLLLYLLARRLIGRGPALLALGLFALSPWHVAWARQARPYALQLGAFLVVLLAACHAAETPTARRATQWTVAGVAAYLVGVLCTFHSILFVGPVGAWCSGMVAATRKLRSRWTVGVLVCGGLGAVTLGALLFNPNEVDQAAVFTNARIGGDLEDPIRPARGYYQRWLSDNLSTGFWIAALVGTVALAWRRDRHATLALLAFWIPFLVLTFLIGYRRPRFLFFAYPAYVMLSAVGVWSLLRWTTLWRHHRIWLPVSAGAALFLLRLGWSAVLLLGNTLETASGDSFTLARRHPQWEEACGWIREHGDPDATILTTTWLPTLYYLGRADEWFPNRYTPWERQESGRTGLPDLDALKKFVAQHPKGYFIAEMWRFEFYRNHGYVSEQLGPEVDWVHANMRFGRRASSDDVLVYAWGDARIE